MKEKIRKISDNIYELPKQGGMRVPGIIFASEKLIEQISTEEITLKQIANVAKLPGIIGHSIAMPDCHMGYGMPIGGVAAFDLKKGVISPGAIGLDINCGVRVLASNLSKDEFLEKREEILREIRKNAPPGVGARGHFSFSDKEIKEILKEGVSWVIGKDHGTKKDMENCEDFGCIPGADPSKVSGKAIGRGRNQLGTIGAGNHFIDVLEIKKIFDKKTAHIFGLKKQGQVCVFIHSGSRGLGHRVASDYILEIERKYGTKSLPDRELACAPLDSELARDYLGAMRAAANFAFANRHLIMCQVRKAFTKYFPESKLDLVYDIAHNIAKFEDFNINGKKMRLCVHRKGATRSLGKGSKELPAKYKPTGQPIFIPGSMGTSSYVLTGTRKAKEISFSSTAHGAGRALSRTYAKKNLSSRKVLADLRKENIVLETGNRHFIDEAPEVYKDINEVVKVSSDLGIARLVAELKPLGVVIG